MKLFKGEKYMEDLTISLEATCDLSKELIKQYDLSVVDMEFMIGDDVFSTKNDDVVSSKLYERMKNGEKTSTSQINEALYEEFFENLAKDDKPIIHLTFSSGLSCTYICAKNAIDKVNKRLGKTLIYYIPTICACSGQGLLAMLVREFSKTASSVEQVVEFAKDLDKKIKHIFTVDTLKYLANGGRLKTSSAIIGTLLNIKPVMQTDDQGRLTVEGKVISRKRALLALVDKIKQTYDKNQKFCFVAHSACEQDAKFVADLIKEQTMLTPMIANLGPIIGSHSGPGTIAMFYVGV